jgi:hypothetical protein
MGSERQKRDRSVRLRGRGLQPLRHFIQARVPGGREGGRGLERSTISNDPQGNPLLSAEAQMPLRAALKRPAYVVQIHTPQNPMPVVLERAFARAGGAGDRGSA